MPPLTDGPIPAPVLAVLRGLGQIFFQEDARSGALIAAGIAVNSPAMAAGALAGSAIGAATARASGFDAAEVSAGIYGFNSALVGLAALFFFRPGAGCLALLAAGCVAAAAATRLLRRHAPFPTYTAPFIVVTWAVFFAGTALGLAPAGPGPGSAAAAAGPAATVAPPLEAVFRGIGQVNFQGEAWAGLLFLAGVALGDRRHAAWALLASALATALAVLMRAPAEDVAMGIYGYNATLAAIALFLRRMSIVPPLLGIVLTVPLTEYFPMLGLPTLTAPFVLATWIVLALGRLELRLFAPPGPPAPP